MERVKLNLSTDQFNDLWQSVDKCRGKTAKVSRDLLAGLLMDHSKLIERYKGEFE